MNSFICKILAIWHYFSPSLGGHCRFYPTCSEYAQISIKKFGLRHGIILSIKRVLKCNSFSGGGIDYPILNNTKNKEENGSR